MAVPSMDICIQGPASNRHCCRFRVDSEAQTRAGFERRRRSVLPSERTNRTTPGRYPIFSQQRIVIGRVTADEAEPNAVAIARPIPRICGYGLSRTRPKQMVGTVTQEWNAMQMASTGVVATRSRGGDRNSFHSRACLCSQPARCAHLSCVRVCVCVSGAMQGPLCRARGEGPKSSKAAEPAAPAARMRSEEMDSASEWRGCSATAARTRQQTASRVARCARSEARRAAWR